MVSNIARPLYDLTQKDKEFRMGEREIAAFNNLKAALLEAPILKFPDFEGNLNYMLTAAQWF